MKKKLIVGVLLFALMPIAVLAQTNEERIASLLAQINALTALLAQMQGNTQTAPAAGTYGILRGIPSLVLTRNLGPGDTGPDVSRLQAHLALDPNIYPEGLVTGGYRNLTTAAVRRFQIACNIISYGDPNTTGFGRVGPVTRRALQYGCAGTPTPILYPTPTPPQSSIAPTSGQPPLNVAITASFPTISCDVAGGVNQIYRLQLGDGTFQELYVFTQGRVSGECGRVVTKTVYHLYTKTGTHTVMLEEMGPTGEGGFAVLSSKQIGTVHVGGTATPTPPPGTSYGIQVRLQNGTSAVARGNALLINWDPTVIIPPSNAAVRLELRRASDNTLVGEGGIVNDLAMNGSYVWNVPVFSSSCSLGNGQLCSNQIIDNQDYHIRAVLYQPRGSCFGTACNNSPTILATGRTDSFTILPTGSATGGALRANPSSGSSPLMVSFNADVNATGSCSASTNSINFGDGSLWENLQVAANTCRPQTFVVNHTYTGNATYTAKLYNVASSSVTNSTNPIHSTTITVSDGSGAGGMGSLLVHADGSDGATSFPDSSSTNNTITRNGNAQIDTAQSKFGGASALFDGSGDYLSVPDSSNWYFGTGDFTVDFWLRLNGLAATNGIFGQGSGSNAYRMYIASDGSVVFQVWNGGVNTIVLSAGAGTFSTGSWYHLALVRNGNSFALYKNGSSIASVSDSDAMPDFAAPFTIGASDGTSFVLNGWIDEFRVVKGSAAWTSSFSVPTAPYGSNPVVEGNSISYNSPGTFTFTTPSSYSSITVTLWGGGGGGGGGNGTVEGSGGNGANGGSSTFQSLAAAGGSGGSGVVGGAGGTASGGDANTSGNSGGSANGVTSGAGGSAPNGGGGGSAVTSGNGNAGTAPGGGGGGGAYAGGGGSGGYVRKTYSSGSLSTNSSVSLAVGSGGSGGVGGICHYGDLLKVCDRSGDWPPSGGDMVSGGSGASGRVTITWQ
ncbi:MAG: hypothetical protein G01um10148_40 [Parcubacteria group bacterium Gr01-1014_8]|nr:MAG: hypothetical protein G01um10148_40 [Parcubacteria group bacterium Gr01-1014_8]